jgi:predicted phosphodiesterase
MREFDRRVLRCPETEQQVAYIAEQIAKCAEETGKKPCDVGWWDFRAFGKIAWGKSRIGIAHRLISNVGGFQVIRDAYFSRRATDLAVVRQRAREHANLNRRLGHAAADEEFQYRQIEAFASRVFRGRVKPIAVGPDKKTKKTKKKGDKLIPRELVVCLGDWHLGADLVVEETGAVNFGTKEEARRVAKIVQQVCTYKPEYRNETTLHVVLLGDFIHGCLHDLRDGAVMAEQKSRAIHLLIQALAHFAHAFRKVVVEAVTGNHGRDKQRHAKPATSGKWDSHEMTIYSAVKAACFGLQNVEWHLPRSAFAVFTIFGKRYFVTHGNDVFKAGNPGQSINVAALESQANRLNATLRDRDEYAVVIVGHAHQAVQVLLNNGVTVIVNGPFTPVDSYAVSIGLFESVCSQQIFEAVPGHPVGDSRRITLDKSVDEDASLDGIIKEWSGF